ncbi:hypothetical protein CBF23_008050 [Marinomonas agarivorans]|nr:hypothetical protein CBF23_008050 [Marinomonas agarivorans]
MRKFLYLSIALLSMTSWASEQSQKVTDSMITNQLKSFAYHWYAKFDNGTTIDELTPYLPEEKLEFIYPQAKITSLNELTSQFEAAWMATDANAHQVEEIAIYKSSENNVYDIITPHTYYIKRKNGTFGELSIVSRMRVRLGLKTRLDPKAELPKIESYLVLFQNAKSDDVTQKISALRHKTFSENDAKSFVHKWFENADLGNANAMIDMVSNQPLGINLFGNSIDTKDALKDYLEQNAAAQKWAIHKPHNIVVTPTPEGFSVRFIVHFEGDIQGMGNLSLNNVTNWLLVEENGELRLRDYSLSLL